MKDLREQLEALMDDHYDGKESIIFNIGDGSPVDAIMALFDEALISELQDLWALSDPIEGIRKRLFDKQPTNGDLNHGEK